MATTREPPPAGGHSTSSEGQLKRAITRNMLLFLVIGDVLGAGVYGSSARWVGASEAGYGRRSCSRSC